VHLHTTPIRAQRSPITFISCDFTRTSFPNIRFDPAPSPKKPACAERRQRDPDPNPILCLPHKPPGSLDLVSTTTSKCKLKVRTVTQPPQGRKNGSGKPISRVKRSVHADDVRGGPTETGRAVGAPQTRGRRWGGRSGRGDAHASFFLVFFFFGPYLFLAVASHFARLLLGFSFLHCSSAFASSCA
jgi:hypothetical protein